MRSAFRGRLLSGRTNVTITAEAKPGFRFRRWDGDLAGTFRSGAVNMSMSRLVRAMLDKVPYVAPTGVRNAAADLARSWCRAWTDRDLRSQPG